MWLPRPVYEAVPYTAVVAGLVCFAVAWWVERSPHSLLFIAGGALVTVGALLWMKRRDYRSTKAGYDPRAIDE
jgi:drug/metabolite transporter (DMT)-like permease